jgi:ABC-type lipoprotein export system ATPase subunit
MRIELRHVRKSYLLPGGGPVTVLENVDLLLECGDRCVVIGSAGSGRTTLLNIIGGLSRPTAGNVLHDGTDLGRNVGLHPGKVAYSFQEPYFVPELTVMENLLLPALHHRDEGIAVRGERLLDDFGLAATFDLFPAILSGGERRRLAVARSLLLPPRLLLLDEPTAGLDDEWQGKTMQLIMRELHGLRATLVIATHDPWPVDEGFRQLRMHRGKVIEHGA